jgi:hypothetical protein
MVAETRAKLASEESILIHVLLWHPAVLTSEAATRIDLCSTGMKDWIWNASDQPACAVVQERAAAARHAAVRLIAGPDCLPTRISRFLPVE